MTCWKSSGPEERMPAMNFWHICLLKVYIFRKKLPPLQFIFLLGRLGSAMGGGRGGDKPGWGDRVALPSPNF